MDMPRDRQQGVTLIELMITIAVAAIMLSIAVPSFTAFAIRNQLVAYNNDLISAVNFARSEAIRRGTTVSVCRRSSDTSCVGGSWSNGWLVVVNTGNVNPGTTAPSGPVLRVHEALTTGYTLGATSSFTNHVTYQADGSANTVGTFAFCHDNDATTARTAILTRLRVRPGKGGIGTCSNP